ncbi:hypothetical protein Tco_0137506, partial [Tanacetum coccineum]
FIAVMSSTSSAITYTSVYTDSKPGRPVAPPSLDYIPGPEDPHRHRQFLRTRMNVSLFSSWGAAIPPVDSLTAESPGYVTESDPEEDPAEYEDDKTEDGPVDYPMEEGDDRDDDDGDSSRDDAEDEEDEEEHLAPADFDVVVPTVEPVSPPEGT